MMALADLPLFAIRAPEDVGGADTLIDVLKYHALGGNRWVSAADIVAALGWPAGGTSERKLRSLVESRPREILSGNRGYCHIAHAEPDEVRHSINRLKAHAEAELQRSVDLSIGYHQFGRSL